MRVSNQSKKTFKEIDELEKLGDFLVKEFNLDESIFSVVIIDDLMMRKLNLAYRGIDKATDVLSFALLDDQRSQIKQKVLGDIYISLDTALRQADEYQHSIKRELSFLMVHGFLHLLGYDHEKDEKSEKKMNKLQKEVLDKYEKS